MPWLHTSGHCDAREEKTYYGQYDAQTRTRAHTHNEKTKRKQSTRETPRVAREYPPEALARATSRNHPASTGSPSIAHTPRTTAYLDIRASLINRRI